jgi:hypothetical protein
MKNDETPNDERMTNSKGRGCGMNGGAALIEH